MRELAKVIFYPLRKKRKQIGQDKIAIPANLPNVHQILDILENDLNESYITIERKSAFFVCS